MRRVALALLAAAVLIGCGDSGPSSSDLKLQESAAFEKRVNDERERLVTTGLGPASAGRQADANARLTAGARARKLLDSGDKDDQARGRAAAEAAGFDPDELKNEDPADFQ